MARQADDSDDEIVDVGDVSLHYEAGDENTPLTSRRKSAVLSQLNIWNQQNRRPWNESKNIQKLF